MEQTYTSIKLERDDQGALEAKVGYFPQISPEMELEYMKAGEPLPTSQDSRRAVLILRLGSNGLQNQRFLLQQIHQQVPYALPELLNYLTQHQEDPVIGDDRELVRGVITSLRKIIGLEHLTN